MSTFSRRTELAMWAGLAGIGLTGSALALLAGTTLVVLRGDWVRWLLLLPVLGAFALWRAFAIIGLPRYEPFDAVTLAYSLPQNAAIFLVLPAVAVAVLASLPMRPDRRVRRRRVHPPGSRPPARDEG